jgi:hypothetical protein
METLDPSSIDTRVIPSGAARTKVDIRIVYTANGTPSADPDSAEVAVNGVITWRTDPGEQRPFEIVSKQTSGPGPHPGGNSHPAGDHQELKRGAGSVPGRYPYGIKANGHVIDPDVIIRPQAQ